MLAREGEASPCDLQKGGRGMEGQPSRRQLWVGSVLRSYCGPCRLLISRGLHPDSPESAYQGPQTTPPRLRLCFSPHPDDSTLHPSQGHSHRISGWLKYLSFLPPGPWFLPMFTLGLGTKQGLGRSLSNEWRKSWPWCVKPYCLWGLRVEVAWQQESQDRKGGKEQT